jgi:hypothetical protein
MEVKNTPSTQTNDRVLHRHTGTSLPAVAVFTSAAGLLLLAWGYWNAWLPHTAAGLTILGIDLAEYVKFVPEVTNGQIPINRQVFFLPLLSLIIGLIMSATIRQPRLPIWCRGTMLALAVPASLALLPPAWTPALLRTPEFRIQTVAILFLLLAILLSPLLYRYLYDLWRGVILILAGIISFPALRAYNRLLPALERLYGHPLQTGTTPYLVAAGAILLAIGGLFVLVHQWRVRTYPHDRKTSTGSGSPA